MAIAMRWKIRLKYFCSVYVVYSTILYEFGKRFCRLAIKKCLKYLVQNWSSFLMGNRGNTLTAGKRRENSNTWNVTWQWRPKRAIRSQISNGRQYSYLANWSLKLGTGAVFSIFYKKIRVNSWNSVNGLALVSICHFQYTAFKHWKSFQSC